LHTTWARECDPPHDRAKITIFQQLRYPLWAVLLASSWKRCGVSEATDEPRPNAICQVGQRRQKLPARRLYNLLKSGGYRQSLLWDLLTRGHLAQFSGHERTQPPAQCRRLKGCRTLPIRRHYREFRRMLANLNDCDVPFTYSLSAMARVRTRSLLVSRVVVVIDTCNGQQ